MSASPAASFPCKVSFYIPLQEKAKGGQSITDKVKTGLYESGDAKTAYIAQGNGAAEDADAFHTIT